MSKFIAVKSSARAKAHVRQVADVLPGNATECDVPLSPPATTTADEARRASTAAWSERRVAVLAMNERARRDAGYDYFATDKLLAYIAAPSTDLRTAENIAMAGSPAIREALMFRDDLPDESYRQLAEQEIDAAKDYKLTFGNRTRLNRRLKAESDAVIARIAASERTPVGLRNAIAGMRA